MFDWLRFAPVLGLLWITHLPVEAQAPARATVYRIPVTGTVEMGLAPYIERSLKEAADAGARCGGARHRHSRWPRGCRRADRRCVGRLKIPTYAYVNRRAFSAGH